MKSVLGKMFNWFSRTWLWFAISKYIIANISFAKPTFPVEQELRKIMKAMADEVEPNCVFTFTSSHRGGLAAKLIMMVDSDWTHAGFLYREGVARHMTSKNYVQEPLVDLLKECDDFAVVKYIISDVDELDYFINVSMRHAIYDYAQGLGNGPVLYCSEAVYEGLVRAGVELETHTNYGREIFSPDDLYDQGKVVYEYRSERCQKLSGMGSSLRPQVSC